MKNKKQRRALLQRIKEKRAVANKKRRVKYKLSKRVINMTYKQKAFQVMAQNSYNLKLPKKFSLRENPETTIQIINDLKSQVSSQKRIYINMKDVEVISNGTIALLLSVVNDFVARGVKIIGKKPQNLEARKILELSGFFKFMDGILEHATETNSNTIIQQGNKAVEPQVTAKLVRSAMETVTGVEQRNKKIQGLFIELMANSINHGFPGSLRKKWIISTSHYEEKECVSFTFIDNGVGILKTLDLKLGTKAINIFKNKEDLLLSAFKGKIGSRTGLPFRGKGLPFILEKFEQNYISNLFILTNNVILDFKTKQFQELKVPYSGTFYYFELKSTNTI